MRSSSRSRRSSPSRSTRSRLSTCQKPFAPRTRVPHHGSRETHRLVRGDRRTSSPRRPAGSGRSRGTALRTSPRSAEQPGGKCRHDHRRSDVARASRKNTAGRGRRRSLVATSRAPGREHAGRLRLSVARRAPARRSSGAGSGDDDDHPLAAPAAVRHARGAHFARGNRRGVSGGARNRGAQGHAIPARQLPPAFFGPSPPAPSFRVPGSPLVTIDSLPVASSRVSNPLRGMGRVLITAAPGSCLVAIDGQARGSTPLLPINLAAGPHTVFVQPLRPAT